MIFNSIKKYVFYLIFLLFILILFVNFSYCAGDDSWTWSRGVDPLFRNIRDLCNDKGGYPKGVVTTHPLGLNKQLLVFSGGV